MNDDDTVTCLNTECGASYRAHKWGNIRAWADQWYVSKDGTESWCPEHLPSWVIKWRERKQSSGTERRK